MIMPVVTVVLPVWTGDEYIEETLKSIQNQTFTNWEMLIIGEPDGSAALKEISERYANEDERIFYLENDKHLGLAATLNRGIELAKGRYIARADVDDPSHPTRFEKQVKYLDAHPEVGILGAQFKQVCPAFSKIINLPVENDDIKASLLFNGYICHPSLMLRRDLFIKNNWRYPLDWPQEDHALWLSLLDKAIFANLGEPLIDHRDGFGINVSLAKQKELSVCEHRLMARTLRDYFNIDVKKYEANRFMRSLDSLFDFIQINELGEWLKDSARILLDIENANRKSGFIGETSLARTLRKRWNYTLNMCFITDVNKLKTLPPHLSEASPDSFSAELISAFNALGFKLPNSPTVDEIVSCVYDCAKSYEKRVKDIVNKRLSVIIFGVGYYCGKFFDEKRDYEKLFEITAFCDNDKSKPGRTKLGKPIIAPKSLNNFRYDYILISSHEFYGEIYSQLLGIGVLPDRMLSLEIFRLCKAPAR